jgi:hypothetical protein
MDCASYGHANTTVPQLDKSNATRHISFLKRSELSAILDGEVEPVFTL